MLKNEVPSSPIKRVDSNNSGTLLSPKSEHSDVRRTPPPTRTTATSSRASLSAVIRRHNINDAEFWRIVTSVPDKRLVQDLDTLDLYLKQNIDSSSKIAAKIDECLFGSNGVYYTVTSRGDIANLQLHAYHLAHTIIHEKNTQQEINGANHIIKAKSVAVMLANVVKMLNKQIDVLPKRAPDRELMQNELLKFSEYISLHAKCLNFAIQYVESDLEQKNSPIRARCLQETLSQWHPGEVAKQTPTKENIGSATKRSIEAVVSARTIRSGDKIRKLLYVEEETTVETPKPSLKKPSKSVIFSNAFTLPPFSLAFEEHKSVDFVSEEEFNAALELSPNNSSKKKSSNQPS